MKKIIVFGGLNLDVSIHSDRVPNVGDYIIGKDFVSTSGGKGGNQAVAAARMGADTFMVGKVGNDHHGRRLTAELTSHGVSVMNVSVTARAATGVAMVVRCGGGYFTITDPGANAKMSYDEVRAAIHGLGQHNNIFLETSGADFDVSMDALACAKRNKLYTILSYAGLKDLPDEAYKDLDLLIVNRTETARLTGIRPANAQAKVINMTTNWTALVIFLMNGKVLLGLGLAAAACNMAGNFVGSGLVMKKGAAVVRPMMVVVIILLFIKLVMNN